MKAGKTASVVALMAATAIACPHIGKSQDTSERNHRIGGGVHYWKTIKQLDDEKDKTKLDDNGISYYGSYQYVIGFFKAEIDVEVFPKNFRGSDKLSITPQAFALVGGLIYGGIGVATTWTDDDKVDKKFSDPFGILRAGLDIELLPALHLDINGNYQFTQWANWDRFDTDTITLGAQARFAF